MKYIVKAYINQELVGETFYFNKYKAEDFVTSFEHLNKSFKAVIEVEEC